MLPSWRDLRWLLKVSRPKFWLYLLGTYALGCILGADVPGDLLGWRVLWFFAWFTFPANLLLYGVNDLSDYDTDVHNPKKGEWEALVRPQARPRLLVAVIVAVVLALPPLWGAAAHTLLAWLLFVVLSVIYSAPPIRLKSRPVIDSLSNVLYVTPMFLGWSLFSSSLPAWNLALAGTCWCAAMHAYSAIPDILPDTRAGVRTVATLLGELGTLRYCLLMYLAAAVLVMPSDLFSGLVLLAYPAIMLAQMRLAPHGVGRWYPYFPLINGFAGMVLTLRFLLPLSMHSPL